MGEPLKKEDLHDVLRGLGLEGAEPNSAHESIPHRVPGLTQRLEWVNEWGVDPKPPAPSEAAEGSSAALVRELEELKSLRDAVFAASYDGICILDGQGVFLEVNAAYERMTGIPRDQWIGRRVEEMQRLPGVPKNSATLQALRGNRPGVHARQRAGRRAGADHREPALRPGRGGAQRHPQHAQHHAAEHAQVPARARARLGEARLPRRRAACVAALAARRSRARRAGVRQRRDGGSAVDRRRGRRLRLDGAARRRDRHRQGAARPLPPPAVAPREQALRRGRTAARSPRASSSPSSSATSAAPSPARCATARRAASSSPTAARSSSTRSASCRSASQAKLLERARRQGRSAALGGSARAALDVRVICATNRDLHELVARGPLPRGSALPPRGDPARICRRCASAPRT